MNHYQVNLRSIINTAPRNPVEALRESLDGPPPALSPIASVSDGLDLLADLGVELRHVMPPFRMGILGRKGIGSPYAVADYFSIDPESERNADFALRRDNPALNRGGWQPLATGERAEEPEKTVVAFSRRAEGQTLHCMFNLGHEARELDDPPVGSLLYGDSEGATLPPFTTRILTG